MRFRVPQFIEIEDKIFGPLTLKQFLYLAGAAGASVVFYLLLPLPVAVILIIATVGFSGALAFYEVNNRPFIFMVENFFNYMIQPRLYVWKKQRRKPEDVKMDEEQVKKELGIEEAVPRVSNSKLEDMAWGLGVKQSLYAETEEAKRRNVGNTKGGIQTLASDAKAKEARKQTAAQKQTFKRQTDSADKQKGQGEPEGSDTAPSPKEKQGSGNPDVKDSLDLEV